MTARVLYFTGPGEVMVREEPIPEPGSGEVRVKSVVSAISPGTELLIYRGEAPTHLSADETIGSLDGNLEFPIQHGYATVGRVTAVGDDVTDDWLDTRVFVFHPHASHLIAAPEELHRIPVGCSTEAVTLLPSVETAVNFLLDGTPRIGERIAVFGQGLVGLLTTALLARCPIGGLVTADLHASRRERSEELGADASLDPMAGNVVDEVRSRLGTHTDPAGADLSIELSGDPSVLDQAIDVTGYGGRVLIGSWYGEKSAPIDLGGRFHRDRIRLISSQVSTIDPRLRGRWTKTRRRQEAWRWIDELDTEDFITHRVPIDRAEEAYRLLDERPDETMGVLLTYPE